MPSLSIVKFKVSVNPTTSPSHRLIGMQIDFFVFHTSPQAFDKYIIHPSPFAVHTDLDTVLFQYVGKGITGDGITVPQAVMPEEHGQPVKSIIDDVYQCQLVAIWNILLFEDIKTSIDDCCQGII